MVSHGGLPFYWDRQRKTVALALQGMLWDTQELESPQGHQHRPEEPSRARKVAWEGDALRNHFCSNQWGRCLLILALPSQGSTPASEQVEQ